MENKIKEGAIYKWEPTDEFKFNGQEFSNLFNTLEKTIASPFFQEKMMEAQQTMSVYSLHQMIKSKLEAAIREGIAKETTPEQLEAMKNENNTPAKAIEESAVSGN